MLLGRSRRTDSSVRVVGLGDETAEQIFPWVCWSRETPLCRARSTNSLLVHLAIIRTQLSLMHLRPVQLAIETRGWLAMWWGRHIHGLPHRLCRYSEDRGTTWCHTQNRPWSPLMSFSGEISGFGFWTRSDFRWSLVNAASNIHWSCVRVRGLRLTISLVPLSCLSAPDRSVSRVGTAEVLD